MNNGRSGRSQTIVNAGLARAWRNARRAFQLTDQSRAPRPPTALSPPFFRTSLIGDKALRADMVQPGARRPFARSMRTHEKRRPAGRLLA
jgi:hypothetical protein